ncbi:MAG: copper resistance protein B [Nitrospirota bacterium]
MAGAYTMLARGARLAAGVLFATAVLVGRAHAVEEGEAHLFTYLQADQLEYRLGGEDTFSWDIRGWIGGDFRKLWVKTQGDDVLDGDLARAELQVLYSRLVAAYWDVQLGVRYDAKPDPSRGFAVVGLHGLAPYFIEVDAAAFVSHHGDLSGRVEAESDLWFTQRLIVSPSIELDAAFQSVPELEIESGIGSVELGLRIRYEIVRELAPYIGVSMEQKIGQTADRARRRGNDVVATTLVAGIRWWF